MAALVLQPSPSRSSAKRFERVLGDSVKHGQIFKRGVIRFSNPKDGLRCQFCEAMFLAAIGCSVPDSVFHIFGVAGPSQIVNVVVVWVAIVMAALSAIRRRSNKRLQNCTMNGDFAFSAKRDAQMSSPFVPRGKHSARLDMGPPVFECDQTGQGLDTPLVADGISAFKPFDGQPNFFHVRPPIAKAPCGGCVAAARNTAFRSNPSHAVQLYD